ncbi:dehydrogenase [Agrobacterium rosae]|uniref:Dehydrogenase n=1 Tax=Agrobacterium rosae TaxID=1972867 RepID=A0AAW9FAC7_9HYPH|nr:dehydrogenase [Agrobacterium rosae]MDX8302810.1 dehydrogenase [Agrobacterium rosae]
MKLRPQFEDPEADPVEHIIEWHDGNERDAIRTLLDDVQFLRGQLAMATLAMGKGYTRGWVPSEERDAV